MKITRLCLPVGFILSALVAWPIGVSLLAATAIAEIGSKRGWHALDIAAAAVGALVFIFWLGVRR